MISFEMKRYATKWSMHNCFWDKLYNDHPEELSVPIRVGAFIEGVPPEEIRVSDTSWRVH